MAVNDLVKVSTAVISVYDKSGIKSFASELIKLNPKMRIISSGGTYRELQDVAAGNLVEVSDYTGFPESPSGVVKTLHPRLHGGILCSDSEAAFMQKHGIGKIDLVVVNLYPFKAAAAGGVAEGSKIENARTNIDVGGVALIEAGCKNFLRVSVITDPSDYVKLLEQLRRNDGQTSFAFRLMLAKKGLAHISSYLQAIGKYFEGIDAKKAESEYLGR